ncbi:hypothetical protein MP228_003601 [Amoeboaphelidium protococcarum]|nr:hypothetical protein MP228_003601 [Amoeboaphelidium protococcarum]
MSMQPKLVVKQTKCPVKQRQHTVNKLYEQYLRLYEEDEAEASEKSLEHEAMIHDASTALTYRNNCALALVKLRKQPLQQSPSKSSNQLVAKEADKSLINTLKMFQLSDAQMSEYDYPSAAFGRQHLVDPLVRQCERCQRHFIPQGLETLTASEREACRFHTAKVYKNRSNLRTYGCCDAPVGSQGCEFGPHVFKYKSCEELQARFDFIDFSSHLKDSCGTQKHNRHHILSIDGEMGYTTQGVELMRLVAVDIDCKVVINTLVETEGDIVEFNTRYSGLTQEMWDDPQKYKLPKKSLHQVRQDLFHLMNKETILAAHSLENDLQALRLIHRNCIDTSILFKHPKGLPYRYSLKQLSKDHLQKFIQESLQGHDPVEDAVITMELIIQRAKHVISTS